MAPNLTTRGMILALVVAASAAGSNPTAVSTAA